MNSIEKIALTICVLSVAITLLDSLAPNGKFKKQIRLILGLVFVLSIIKPLREADFSDYDFFELINTKEYIEANALFNEHLSTNLEKSIEKKLEIRLNQEEIYTEKIEILINIIEDNCIDISRVYVLLEEKFKSEEENIDEIILNETDCEIRIIEFYEED